MKGDRYGSMFILGAIPIHLFNQYPFLNHVIIGTVPVIWNIKINKAKILDLKEHQIYKGDSHINNYNTI